MTGRPQTHEGSEAAAVPTGAPPWITAEPRQTWQPYYTQQLTDTDLLEILHGVSRLFKALEDRDE